MYQNLGIYSQHSQKTNIFPSLKFGILLGEPFRMVLRQKFRTPKILSGWSWTPFAAKKNDAVLKTGDEDIIPY